MPSETDPVTRPLTPAQQQWLTRLYENFQSAQVALNDFTRYLMAEHQIPDDGGWEIAPDLTGFVRVGERTAKG